MANGERLFTSHPMPHEPDEINDDFDSDDDILVADMACPECRRPVTIDTQKCPHCGDWITPVYPATEKRRRWLFLLAVALMLLAMLSFIL